MRNIENVFLDHSNFESVLKIILSLMIRQFQFDYMNAELLSLLKWCVFLFVYCVEAYCCSVLREEGNGR